MITRHDEFSELLGAYALDAVDPDEAQELELHLRTCAVCAQEVAEHREVASLLVHSGSTAPDGVWDRIASELSPPPPALRLTLAPVHDPDPVAVAAEGGADNLIARLGKHTSAGFWGLRPMPEKLWEAMAAEHSQGQRALD